MSNTDRDRYFWDEEKGLIRKNGRQIMQIIPINCSLKLRRKAGLAMSEHLNNIQEKENDLKYDQIMKIVVELTEENDILKNAFYKAIDEIKDFSKKKWVISLAKYLSSKGVKNESI